MPTCRSDEGHTRTTVLLAGDMRGNVGEIEAAAEPRISGVTKLCTDVLTGGSVRQVPLLRVRSLSPFPAPVAAASPTPRSAGSGSTPAARADSSSAASKSYCSWMRCTISSPAASSAEDSSSSPSGSNRLLVGRGGLLGVGEAWAINVSAETFQALPHRGPEGLGS